MSYVKVSGILHCILILHHNSSYRRRERERENPVFGSSSSILHRQVHQVAPFDVCLVMNWYTQLLPVIQVHNEFRFKLILNWLEWVNNNIVSYLFRGRSTIANWNSSCKNRVQASWQQRMFSVFSCKLQHLNIDRHHHKQKQSYSFFKKCVETHH